MRNYLLKNVPDDCHLVEMRLAYYTKHSQSIVIHHDSRIKTSLSAALPSRGDDGPVAVTVSAADVQALEKHDRSGLEFDELMAEYVDQEDLIIKLKQENEALKQVLAMQIKPDGLILRGIQYLVGRLI